MLEYALIAGLIVVACITVIGLLSTKIKGVFTERLGRAARRLSPSPPAYARRPPEPFAAAVGRRRPWYPDAGPSSTRTGRRFFCQARKPRFGTQVTAPGSGRCSPLMTHLKTRSSGRTSRAGSADDERGGEMLEWALVAGVLVLAVDRRRRAARRQDDGRLPVRFRRDRQGHLTRERPPRHPRRPHRGRVRPAADAAGPDARARAGRGRDRRADPADPELAQRRACSPAGSPRRRWHGGWAGVGSASLGVARRLRPDVPGVRLARQRRRGREAAGGAGRVAAGGTGRWASTASRRCSASPSSSARPRPAGSCGGSSPTPGCWSLHVLSVRTLGVDARRRGRVVAVEHRPPAALGRPGALRLSGRAAVRT